MSLAPQRSRPVVTLTTDFGLGSPYVAQMKGVVLSICPQATLVDVTHEVRPQGIAGGNAAAAFGVQVGAKVTVVW